jgi:hypothetical protein
VRAARRFFAAGYDGFTWPLAVLDHDLATLAWLKRPLQAPDLPRKQIIADCYAALRPEGRLAAAGAAGAASRTIQPKPATIIPRWIRPPAR